MRYLPEFRKAVQITHCVISPQSRMFAIINNNNYMNNNALSY